MTIANVRRPHALLALLLCALAAFWSSTDLLARKPGSRLQFATAEEKWMALHPVVLFTTDPDWPPYSHKTEDGSVEGIDPEILDLVSERTGLKFQYYPTTSWSESLAALKSGSVQCIAGIWRSDDRARSITFTSAYLSCPIGIITRSEAQFFTTLKSLHGKRVAIPPDYDFPPEYFADLNESQIIATKDSASAHRMVASGDADATLDSLPVSAHLIRKLGLTNLKVSGVMDQPLGLHYGVRSDQKELAGILEKAVKSLSRHEIDEITDRWVESEVNAVIVWNRFYPWLVPLAVMIVLMVFMSALWVHRLRKEIEQRKAAESELTTAHKKLNEANEERTCLMQIAAHDLRNPLTALIASVSLLRTRPSGSADWNKWLETLEESAGRIEHLVRTLLDFETIQAGRFPLRLASVAVSEVVNNVLARQNATAERKQITFSIHHASPNACVLADPHALEEIVENVLSNAIKFSPAGSAISLASKPGADTLCISVTDHGPGLNETDKKHLFERFSKLSARPTGGEQSVGLGLWIAHRLAELQNGRLWCESAEGKGATFHLELPASQAGAQLGKKPSIVGDLPFQVEVHEK